VARQKQWPEWWEWELELTPHIEKRMIDRGFGEIDVRKMLASARRYRQDVAPGRWVIETRHRRRPWEVIVEPDAAEGLLSIVTAYPVEKNR